MRNILILQSTSKRILSYLLGLLFQEIFQNLEFYLYQVGNLQS